ncbi:MAG: GNAT family N-acetyltransferase [Burkholderiaceae bacterium]
MQFRQTRFADDLLGITTVRAIVFIDGQNCPVSDEYDGLDDDAIQILGLVDGEPVACGRIRTVGGIAKLERLAIRRQWRGQGHGNGLLEFMMQVARARGHKRFKLHAQVQAVGFYRRHGFEPGGPVFQEVGIDHLLMTRDA